jgi:hypothetical protein
VSTARDQFDPIFDRYLDGDLTPQERAEFERHLESHPELGRELAQQARIDESLRRAFELPAPPALRSAPARPARATTASRTPTRRRLALALAASLALAALGTWRIWAAVAAPRAGYGPRLAMETVYRDAAAGRLDPWVCRDQREFAATFRQHFDEAIVLGQLPQGVEASGLAYAHTLSPKTICLVGRVQGDPVVVFVDRAERAAAVTPPDCGDLQIFERRLGKLILFEISPLPAPALLEFLDRAPPQLEGTP